MVNYFQIFHEGIKFKIVLSWIAKNEQISVNKRTGMKYKEKGRYFSCHGYFDGAKDEL